MIIILSIIICAILLVGEYLILKPRLVATKNENDQIQAEKEQLLSECNNLDKQKNKALDEVEKLNKNKAELLIEKQSVKNSIEDLKNSLSILEKQAQDASDVFYKTKMESAQLKVNHALAELEKIQTENIDSFQKEYDEIIGDLLKEFQELSSNVQEMRQTHAAAIEAAKRAEEMRTEKDFYKIQLSDIDIAEIKTLRSIEPALRNKEPLNKVIWKCYYEKPTNDLIGRVVGNKTVIGIYKITEIETGKCYIGQSVNIADRWKQHIKRGVGAETPTQNKLYPAMRSTGPENFTFEIVESCERSLLDNREDFWQDYFGAKEFGYSIK